MFWVCAFWWCLYFAFCFEYFVILGYFLFVICGFWFVFVFWFCFGILLWFCLFALFWWNTVIDVCLLIGIWCCVLLNFAFVFPGVGLIRVFWFWFDWLRLICLFCLRAVICFELSWFALQLLGCLYILLCFEHWFVLFSNFGGWRLMFILVFWFVLWIWGLFCFLFALWGNSSSAEFVCGWVCVFLFVFDFVFNVFSLCNKFVGFLICWCLVLIFVLSFVWVSGCWLLGLV